MSPQSMYSTILAPGEKSAGFVEAYVSNPRKMIAGNSSIVRAVILDLGPGDRIVKLTEPDGKIQYSHEKFGTCDIKHTEYAWLPIGVSLDNLMLAINSSRSGADAHLAGITVYPAKEKMEVRCPRCSHEFELRHDYLAIGILVQCPKCKSLGRPETFARRNALGDT